MKRLNLLLAIMTFANMIAFAQKKYEMVIEKTDGSSAVINTEDIIRTYFRERTDGGNTNVNIELLYGTWKLTWEEGHETDPYNGPFDYSKPPVHFVHYYQFYKGGTFLHWGIEDGKYEEQRFDGTFSVDAGNNLVMTSNNWSHDIIYYILLLDNTTLKIKDDFGDGDYEIQTYTKVDDEDSQQTYLSCPDDHHPHMIDLGLPSGTLWACCNVGADKPEAYGDYYAWGETNTKSTYSWSTYTHCDGSSSTCHNLGSDIAGTQYDVAHVKWGGSWVMPSKEQQDELRNNCTYEWTTVNGVKGGKFTSKANGGSMFLPAAGDRSYSDLNYAGSRGDYWSSTQGPSYTGYAYYLYFYSSSTRTDSDYRYYGRSVRPVVRN